MALRSFRRSHYISRSHGVVVYNHSEQVGDGSLNKKHEGHYNNGRYAGRPGVRLPHTDPQNVDSLKVGVSFANLDIGEVV